jgi:hypothetical protein
VGAEVSASTGTAVTTERDARRLVARRVKDFIFFVRIGGEELWWWALVGAG